ncbi:hypothetical protein AB4Z42_21620 [Mycobacterium sp. 2YAF39]|uniref:hypothetical protein n=1 Tax=Mycobacterium sp. 2YAF39 TaxID=3233033 RepID=UPI003F9CD1C5
MRNRGVRLAWAVTTALTLVACGSGGQSVVATSTDETAVTSTATIAPAPPATPESRAKDWFDLDVGDCLVALPRVDLGEVSVGLVDCTNPHAGEVFLRAPVEVDDAVADVADKQCGGAVTEYTGRAAGDTYTVTYLIDSNQDRTSANPLPSTVICLLQAADGGQLTGSAKR